MASIINATTTNGVAVQGDNSGSLQLQTNNGTTAVTIDTSQNVGIGTSSPSVRLDVASTGNTVLALRSTSSGSPAYYIEAAGGGTPSIVYKSTQNLRFATADDSAYTNYTERMRIDSSGNLLVGTTTSLANGLTVNGGDGPQLSLNTTTRFTQLNFYNSGTQKGFISFDNTNTRLIIQNASAGVYLSSGATSWTSNSDERNKDIIEPITDAVNKVSTLRTVIGKYKTDNEDKRRAFLIAQDVQKVLPEAVEASNPDDLGVNYTDVIPLLVAAIQELKAELDATKAEVQALKGVA